MSWTFHFAQKRRAASPEQIHSTLTKMSLPKITPMRPTRSDIARVFEDADTTAPTVYVHLTRVYDPYQGFSSSMAFGYACQIIQEFRYAKKTGRWPADFPLHWVSDSCGLFEASDPPGFPLGVGQPRLFVATICFDLKALLDDVHTQRRQRHPYLVRKTDAPRSNPLPIRPYPLRSGHAGCWYRGLTCCRAARRNP